jgi:hypothetical protein
MSRFFNAALGLLVICGTAQAQSTTETFLAELQTALRNGDRTAVAAQIQYPVTVMIGGLRVPFPDAAALLERYDDVFTPALLDTVARADAPAVIDDQFVIGTNALVIKPIGQRLRIIAIHVPPPGPPSVSHRPLSEAKPTRAARPPGPRRIGIRAGPRPTQIPGALLPGTSDVYMVWVPKGKLLEIRLNRVQGRAALIRVVHAETGAPLNPRIPGAARVVSGIATESGDYRIEVRHGEAQDAAPLPYTVSLSLR